MKKLYSLIDKIYREENLRQAFKAVKKNHGAPGEDGETVEDFTYKLDENIKQLHEELKTDTYKPSPVKRVEIDKPDGGKRPLGLPTVRDKVVQQAIVNIIEPYFDKDFHPSSYGYRKNHSQHQAVTKAEQFINKHGLRHVVDMDLSKCFDTLIHDRIIASIGKKISDTRVLRLIRNILEAGVMVEGNYTATEQGSPQGGVCSPLISNIYLDYFDQKMMSKGIRIVRYADDILIFARDKQSAGNYKAYATKILEEEMGLTVNKEKTKITRVYEGVSYLGFVINSYGISIDPKRVKRFKDKLRRLTKRNAGKPIEVIVKTLNPVLRGWINYYRLARIKGLTKELMSWIRRRLRMIRMKQWKTYKKMHKEMRKQGIKGTGEKMAVTKWKNSNVHIIHMLLPNEYFEKLGLVDLSKYEVGLLSSY
ncbi:MAG: group II intron reverse transcriptase/maturase [Peptostreptococcaceae bacterium]|nr:group II intron reverse transcriptase/maturase [Peptostreptococcaceae bacterium]